MPDGESAAARRKANLLRLLAPRHAAFIGGRDAARAMDQCVAIGFKGEIWPVHPQRANMEGRPCFRTVADLPEPPDAAFVAVPAAATVEVVRQLAEGGAGGAVCYAAGFAERGGEGVRLQESLVTAAGDMALVGPNCYGLLNYLDGAALWAEGHGGRPVGRGVALITQSGNIGINLTMEQRSVPIAYVVSAGNQACLGIEDYVAALLQDSRVTAIGLYIEGLANVASFAQAAAAALERGVPLVALKSGNSDVGARLALSHTSSLAGSEALYDALFERLGVVRVGSLSALMETVKFLALVGPLPGRRLGALSCSGGEASLVADLAAKLGLQLPDLLERQQGALAAQLPDFVTLSNPFDYNTSVWGDRAAQERCFGAFLDGPIDAGLLVLDMPRPGTTGIEGWHLALSAFLDAREKAGIAGAVVATLPESLPEATRDQIIERGAAPLQGFEDGLGAIAAAAWYGERRAAIDRAGAARLLIADQPPGARSARMLDERACKERLAAFGLGVPESRVVNAAEAPAAARALGFPVVVKALAAGRAHKTEAGAVALDLRSEAEVASAVARMSALGARFLVERMVAGAVAELIVGVRRDPQFGLALVVGSGGVLVELVGDSRTLLLPCDRAALTRALDSLKAARLLDGFRGRPPGDREAVLDAMEAIAAFAESERQRLVELDVNPLLVLPEGVVAVDAMIRLEGD